METRPGRREDSEGGFSLIELLIAMMVTLIVTGAIYGLLASGQSAFRREPELSDRQQNIRVAMDLIMRDVANAGSGMPTFMQTFTQNLNACVGCPDGGAPAGLDGEITDELEIFTNDEAREPEPACSEPGGANSEVLRLVRNGTGLAPNQPVMIIFEDGTWTFRNITSTGQDGGNSDRCKAVQQDKLTFNQGTDTSGMNTPGGICKPSDNGLGNAGAPADGGESIASCPSETPANTPPGPCCVVERIAFAQVVRYRIRKVNDIPVLQRTDLTSGWQTVARGIEDLQVQYTQADGTVTVGDPGAPKVTPNLWGSMITEVTVTLSARSEARRLQGMTRNDSARAEAALRGRLTASGSPRSSLVALTQQTPDPAGDPFPQLWK